MVSPTRYTMVSTTRYTMVSTTRYTMASYTNHTIFILDWYTVVTIDILWYTISYKNFVLDTWRESISYTRSSKLMVIWSKRPAGEHNSINKKGGELQANMDKSGVFLFPMWYRDLIHWLRYMMLEVPLNTINVLPSILAYTAFAHLHLYYTCEKWTKAKLR